MAGSQVGAKMMRSGSWLMGRGAAVLITALLGVGMTAQAAELRVEQPWVRAMPEVSQHTAAYMRLINDSDRPRRLVAADVAGYARVELHETIDKDGVARMRQREELVVPPHGVLVLRPGGKHVMLMDRERASPAEGELLELVLVFDDTEQLRLEAPVLLRGPDGVGGHDDAPALHGHDAHHAHEHDDHGSHGGHQH